MSTAILPDDSIIIRLPRETIHFDATHRWVHIRAASLRSEQGGAILASYPLEAVDRVRLHRLPDGGFRLSVVFRGRHLLDLGPAPSHDVAVLTARSIADLTRCKLEFCQGQVDWPARTGSIRVLGEPPAHVSADPWADTRDDLRIPRPRPLAGTDTAPELPWRDPGEARSGQRSAGRAGDAPNQAPLGPWDEVTHPEPSVAALDEGPLGPDPSIAALEERPLGSDPSEAPTWEPPSPRAPASEAPTWEAPAPPGAPGSQGSGPRAGPTRSSIPSTETEGGAPTVVDRPAPDGDLHDAPTWQPWTPPRANLVSDLRLEAPALTEPPDGDPDDILPLAVFQQLLTGESSFARPLPQGAFEAQAQDDPEARAPTEVTPFPLFQRLAEASEDLPVVGPEEAPGSQPSTGPARRPISRRGSSSSRGPRPSRRPRSSPGPRLRTEPTD